MNTLEIFEEIRNGQNLDKHILNEDKFVRREVAKQGYKLALLKNDPSADVRAAVAEQGYALNELTKDPDSWVRLHALDKLNALNARNAGYEIIARMDAGNHHFALGHHPKAPAPYVTWDADPERGDYHYGHYFLTYEDAFIDLTKRISQAVNLGDRSLGMELLTEEDRMTIYMEQRNEDAIEDIKNILANYDDYDYDALINDSDFMEKAKRTHHNMDHSYENEALDQCIQELLEEFPQYKEQPMYEVTHAEVKIPPEQRAFLNDLLSMSIKDICNKYGPVGDDIDIAFPFGDSLTGYISISFSEGGYDSKPKVSLTLYDYENPYNRTVISDIGEIENIANSYSIESPNGQSFTMTLQEDESLRRIGNQFKYLANTDDEHYAQHNGELCTITRALTPKECDMLYTGMMWEAQFPNGDALHIFDDELTPCESLDKKIANAQSKGQAHQNNNRSELFER